MRRLGAWLLLCGFCLLVYSPALNADYLIRDDYTQAFWFFPELTLGMGRPVCTLEHWAHHIVAQAAGPQAMQAMAHLRLLSIGLLALVGVLLAGFIRRQGFARLTAWGAAVGVCALPGAGLYVAWLGASHYLIGLLLACLSAHWAMTGHPARAGAVLVVALATNQSAAMFYWVLAGIWLWGLARKPEWPPRRGFLIAEVFASAGAAMGVYFVLASAASAWLLQGNRFRAAFDPLGKAAWLFGEAVPNTLGLWSVYRQPLLVWGCAALLAGWLIAGVVGAFRSPAARGRLVLGTLVAACFMACFTPQLATAESWAAYRTIFPASALLVFACFASLETVAQRLSPRIGRRFTAAMGSLAAAVVLAGAAWVAHGNVHERLVGPQEREWDRLVTLLRAEVAPRTRRIQVLLNQPIRASIDAPRYDEYGCSSGTDDWCALPMVQMALREAGHRPEEFQVSCATRTTNETVARPARSAIPVAGGDPGLLVVDMRRLAR